jgi:hypothetical protein
MEKTLYYIKGIGHIVGMFLVFGIVLEFTIAILPILMVGMIWAMLTNKF